MLCADILGEISDEKERCLMQKSRVPAPLVKEGLVIIGSTMAAIVEEDEGYSTDDGSISLAG